MSNDPRPEPQPGTFVRDALGRVWVGVRPFDDEYQCWLRWNQDVSDPESWAKVNGNYGPATVMSFPMPEHELRDK